MRFKWVGPFQIKTYLENAISNEKVWGDRWPCERDAVYVVSRHAWAGNPAEGAQVLYVGGNTGSSSRFVTRIGDLIADIHGFWGERTGHHSGGQTLWKWCDHHRVHPGDLWLAWARNPCVRCAERHLYETLPRATRDDFSTTGLLNKKSPPRCSQH